MSQPEGFACPVPAPAPRDAILLGHGSGGRLSRALLEELILPAFDSAPLRARDDQAILEVGGARVAFTTDGFVVTPLFFPGGDIGALAVHGTVNDLACAGATPLHLSVAFIIAEGFPRADLARVVDSIRRAAAAAGVQVVTGDTKVVPRAACDGLFVTTSGLGLIPAGAPRLTAAACREGDAVALSGTLADHGVAVMAARERLELGDQVRSDTAPLTPMAQAAIAAAPGLRCMRDPTRGGLAAALSELGHAAGLSVEIDEAALPLDDATRGALELLGLDPLLVANEGKLVAVAPADELPAVVAAWRAHPLGARAAQVARFIAGRPGGLIVRTRLGTRRTLELPATDPLPRIC